LPAGQDLGLHDTVAEHRLGLHRGGGGQGGKRGEREQKRRNGTAGGFGQGRGHDGHGAIL